MATDDTNITQSPVRFRLPDPPESEPDDVTSFDRLTENGNAYLLKRLLLARQPTPEDNIIVSGQHYLVDAPTALMGGSRYPDLLVAFDADPTAYRASNGYIISEQGKPPDFVLEIASVNTVSEDTGPKRDDYAALGILEYWRFDATGQRHGTKIAGDRLVDGVYEPIPIDELDNAVLQGYSTALNLILRWEQGQLGWYDPEKG